MALVERYTEPDAYSRSDLQKETLVVRPLAEEGVFNSDDMYAVQQAAYDNLPEYPVTVVRRSSHKPPESTSYATIYQESVRYSDGAVRLATIAEPKESYFGSDGISRYAVSSGDPWLTGPDGLNKYKIDELANRGFFVIFNHHQGRHSLWPINRERIESAKRFLSSKSVGKSAHHDHALLDDLSPYADCNFDQVIRESYSRSAMSGKAFISLGPRYGRETVWADLEAPCFEHEGDVIELLETAVQQIPKEAVGLGKLALKYATQAIRHADPAQLLRMLGTFDLHPLNVAHEVAWIKPLINGDAGVYGRAMPLDIAGVLTLYSGDIMSHQQDWRAMHRGRPNFAIVEKSGPHVAGAFPENLQMKFHHFDRLMDYMRQNDMSLTGITPEHVLAPEELEQAA